MGLFGSIGSIASAIGSVGSLFGGGGDEDSARAMRQANKQNKYFAQASLDEQKLLAREGIRMRVEDAKAAGIHPLYALGAPSMNFSPVSAGIQPEFRDDGPNMWDRMTEAGNNISRAMAATQTSTERLQERLLSAQIEGQEIDNAKKRSDLVMSSQVGPPLPSGMGKPVSRYIPLVNPDGSVTSVTNPDAGDNELLMAWDFLSKTWPDELKVLGNRTLRNLRNHFTRPKNPRAQKHPFKY